MKIVTNIMPNWHKCFCTIFFSVSLYHYIYTYIALRMKRASDRERERDFISIGYNFLN